MRRALASAAWSRWALLALVTTTAGCQAGVEHGLDEREANEVVAALDSEGLRAEKLRDGEGAGGASSWHVDVARSELPRAIAVLADRSLPHRRASTSGLLPTPAGERQRREAELSIELERTLAGLPGVASARVHVALPDDEPLRGELGQPRPTASVLLRVRASNAAPPVGADLAVEARRLLAGAVAGLAPNDVAVVVATAAPLPPSVVALGPITVAPGSRPLVLALLAGGLALVLALALLVAVLAARLAAARRA